MINKLKERLNQIITANKEDSIVNKACLHITLEESKQLLQELEAMEKENEELKIGDWYCPECEVFICAENVTNDEKHDTCGSEVLWVGKTPEEK